MDGYYHSIIPHSDRIRSNDDAIPQSIYLSIEAEDIGFFSNYVAMITWDVNQTDYDSYGYGIIGFETPTTGNNAILTNHSTTFLGGGRGKYSDASGNQDITFKIAADVDFNQRTVTLTSTDTSTDICDISTCVETERSDLNFSGNLMYEAGKNALNFTTITTNGNTNSAKLTGTANARFYGADADELGGTFNLKNSDTAYVGGFGALRDYIPSIDKPTSFNDNGLKSFVDPARNGTTNNVLEIVNAVEITRQVSDKSMIVNNNINNAMAAFSYEDDGSFEGHGNGLILYFTDKRYRTAYGYYDTLGWVFDTAPDAISNGSTDTPNEFGLLTNQNKIYGGSDFPMEHMALIEWELREETYDSSAYAVVGFETAGTDIPTTGTAVSFTGYGKGDYYTANKKEHLFFDVTINVNFEQHQVSLTTEDICRYPDSVHSCNQFELWRPHLGFTAQTLNYTANTNNITGAIQTDGDTENAKLTGTANARFYGIGDDATKELGGTFSLSNDDAGYVGFFGAKKQ